MSFMYLEKKKFQIPLINNYLIKQDFQIKPVPDASHRLLQAFAPGTVLYFEVSFLKKSEKLNMVNFEVRAIFGGHSVAMSTYHMSFLCTCTSILVQFAQ